MEAPPRPGGVFFGSCFSVFVGRTETAADAPTAAPVKSSIPMRVLGCFFCSGLYRFSLGSSLPLRQPPPPLRLTEWGQCFSGEQTPFVCSFAIPVFVGRTETAAAPPPGGGSTETPKSSILLRVSEKFIKQCAISFVGNFTHQPHKIFSIPLVCGDFSADEGANQFILSLFFGFFRSVHLQSFVS